jgi:hypothetical protein
MADKEISPLLIIGIIALVALAFYFAKSGATFSSVGLSSSSCVDSDNGLDIYSRSTITGGISNTGYPILNPQYDDCNSDVQVIEMYCSEDGYRKAMVIDCPGGSTCADGICSGGSPGGAQ